ncbi:MAG: DUF2804 domain-containing protein [Treponema sp.]|nr:DUF2804 domain-containing protein [Treponema sp.]
MYTREFAPPASSPVENGDSIIGTWNKAFDRVNLQEIRRPFGYPFPRWLKDCRIKEWQSFSAHDDNYALEALFCNVKMYRMAHIILFDKKNEQRFIYKKIMPGTGWHLPESLANSSIDCHISRFYFRIHSWLDADAIKLDINIEGTRKQPSLTVHLAYNLNNQETAPIAVSLALEKRCSMYAYKVLAPVRGDMVFAGNHINMKQDTCSGFFCDYKGFFPYRMKTTICSGMGFNEDVQKKRRFGFHIAENQTGETNKNNENAFWLDGKLTLLPPVLITMPNGPDGNWVIQDVEGMVDLTFTPKYLCRSGTKLVITTADFISPLGYYNGMLASSDGEKIQIKNLLGLGEKLYLRV